MKRNLKLVASTLVIAILAIAANHFIVHMDSGGKRIGCLEYLFFHRAIFKPSWSNNDIQMSLAQLGSEEIIDLIDTYGTNLISDSSINDLRLFALEISNEAIDTSESVEIVYLKKIHNQLPEDYRDKFIKSLILWKEGFSECDLDKLTEGSLLNEEDSRS